MKKQFRIKSIKHFIEIKTKRLNYTRTPYLREYLLQDIEDLKQVEWLFAELEAKMRELEHLIINTPD